MKIEDLNHDRRVVIYPAYIDKTKTEKQGRRIPKELCVEGPVFPEILMACAHLKLAAQPEQKYYPRAGVMELGRVRVQLKNDLNQPLNDDIQDRRTLFRKVAEFIRQEPARVKRGGKPPAMVMTNQGIVLMEPKDAEKLQLQKAKEAAQAAAQQMGVGPGGPQLPNAKKMMKAAKKAQK